MFNQTEPQISEASNHLKHLTESEMLDVLECARKVSARDHALILVTYIYGLRNQEVARLRLTDLNWDSMTITARRQKNSLTTEQPLVRHKGRPAFDVVGALETWLPLPIGCSLRLGLHQRRLDVVPHRPSSSR